MEWVVGNPQLPNMFTSLGSQVGDQYIVGRDCQSGLNEVLQKLAVEDATLCFRRAIGFSQIVKKDLLPVLINAKDELKITNTVIKIFAHLTTPVECLLPIEVISKTEAGRNTIIELNWLLFSCKEIFSDQKSTRRITDHIKNILEKGEKMVPNDIEALNDSVVLLRNILHIPELRPSTNGTSRQNQIVWNLFTQNIDKILIDLMTGTNRGGEWKLTMVQLLSLLYKDQNVLTLQKSLNNWFETSFVSESSEDNESNTSPLNRGSGDSSSITMSDPTSDSSDNSCDKKCNEFNNPKTTRNYGSRKTQKQHSNNKEEQSLEAKTTEIGKTTNGEKKMGSVSSETSDCGYVTQAENQDSISTSSSDGDSPLRYVKPVHQKPVNMIQKSRYVSGKPTMTIQDKQEMKRKKLMKRSRTNMVNMKALLHHTPTEEDIAQLLKEFTVDFLLKGFSSLVSDLREQLLNNAQDSLHIDTSHFFWLVTYFLKFAVQLEIDMELIGSVFSFKILSFLTFQGVVLCGQFEQGKLYSNFDMSSCLRRVHLLVTAIREVIQTINYYSKSKYLNDNDKEKIQKLQRKICETEELRCLFVLLLRQFNPKVHSMMYLQDLIVANHLLLSMVDSCASAPPNFSRTLQKHLKQFADASIMQQYGYLLTSYKQNGQFVNDCVFTMMHHIAGDLKSVSILFQPVILKTFSHIHESNFELCGDWIDLIEYVIHIFINIQKTLPVISQSTELNEFLLPLKIKEWSHENCNYLQWFYVQSVDEPDVVGKIIKQYEEIGIKNKTRAAVIEQLLKQEVINNDQYNQLLKNESSRTGGPFESVTKMSNDLNEVTDNHSRSINQDAVNKDEIEILKEHLSRENKFKFVVWVQKVLLEACYAKLSFMKDIKLVSEPVAYHCTLLQEPIPMIPWNCKQSFIMKDQAFLLLISKLGLHVPADLGKGFICIPQNLSPEMLYSLASKLGPLRPDWEKLNITGLNFNQQLEMATASTSKE